MLKPIFQTKLVVVLTKASIQITGTLKTLHANSATDSIEYGKIPRSVGMARNVSFYALFVASDLTKKLASVWQPFVSKLT